MILSCRLLLQKLLEDILIIKKEFFGFIQILGKDIQ
nr:MAG TPA: hypothetical protein [Caudoviricetes sp.]DAK59247.1 MAG TPA: hypothetical protein [Caudoviricetes sp.]